MRLLLCLPALVLAAVTVASDIADACGAPVRPNLVLISSHRSPATIPNTRRAFAVRGGPADAPVGATWTPLAPQSFDPASIHDLGSAKRSVLTLVGPSGTRVVKTHTRRLLIQESIAIGHEVHEASEVPVGMDDHFPIAIVGNAKHAKWHELEALGLGALPLYAATYRFELLAGSERLGTYDGIALGVLEYGGKRYLVIKDGAYAKTEILPVTAR